MKQTIKTIGKIMLVSITAIFLHGCAGKDGAPGAQGPEGNANVTAMSYQILSSQWAYASPNLWVDLIDPDITADIINSGAVLVYSNSVGDVTQLPFTYYPSTSYSETMSAVHYVGNVQINIVDSDGATPNAPGDLIFKVVVMSSRHMLQNPHINFHDYTSVQKAFNLK